MDTKLEIRSFNRHTDLDTVSDIEIDSYSSYLTVDEIRSLSIDRTTRIHVMETETGEIVSFIIFKPLKDKFYIERLATTPHMRRSGAARALLNHLKELAITTDKTLICGLVNEYNLGSQLFAKREGFDYKETQNKEGIEYYYFEWGSTK